MMCLLLCRQSTIHEEEASETEKSPINTSPPPVVKISCDDSNDTESEHQEQKSEIIEIKSERSSILSESESLCKNSNDTSDMCDSNYHSGDQSESTINESINESKPAVKIDSNSLRVRNKKAHHHQRSSSDLGLKTFSRSPVPSICYEGDTDTLMGSQGDRGSSFRSSDGSEMGIKYTEAVNDKLVKIRSKLSMDNDKFLTSINSSDNVKAKSSGASQRNEKSNDSNSKNDVPSPKKEASPKLLNNSSPKVSHVSRKSSSNTLRRNVGTLSSFNHGGEGGPKVEPHADVRTFDQQPRTILVLTGGQGYKSLRDNAPSNGPNHNNSDAHLLIWEMKVWFYRFFFC